MAKVYTAIGISICLCFLLASLSSCEKRQEETSGKLLDDNLLKNGSEFRKLLRSRDAGGRIPFAIQEIKRISDSLFIAVLGGCSENAYRIIWDGLIAESHPAQIRLLLVHDPAGDICDPSAEFLLRVDLNKIIGEAGDPEDFIFHLANGSVKQDKSLYPDGTVATLEE
ncbi:MAG: hypothetical protein FWJ85_06265 [Solitalea sp.]